MAETEKGAWLPISVDTLVKWIVGILCFMFIAYAAYNQNRMDKQEARVDQLETSEYRNRETAEKIEELKAVQRVILDKMNTVERCIIRMSYDAVCPTLE